MNGEGRLLSAGLWKRGHFMATLCETHGKTAHVRVPHTAAVSKAKYNGIDETSQPVNEEQLDFRG